jgi:hypothetical protein
MITPKKTAREGPSFFGLVEVARIELSRIAGLLGEYNGVV